MQGRIVAVKGRASVSAGRLIRPRVDPEITKLQMVPVSDSAAEVGVNARFVAELESFKIGREICVFASEKHGPDINRPKRIKIGGALTPKTSDSVLPVGNNRLQGNRNTSG